MLSRIIEARRFADLQRQTQPAITPPSTSWIAPVVQPAVSDLGNERFHRFSIIEIGGNRFGFAFATSFELTPACGQFVLLAPDKDDGAPTATNWRAVASPMPLDPAGEREGLAIDAAATASRVRTLAYGLRRGIRASIFR
jgi:hypothetical protein